LHRCAAADVLGLGAGDAVRLEPLADGDDGIVAPTPLAPPQRRR